jgi:hypothetical protein
VHKHVSGELGEELRLPVYVAVGKQHGVDGEHVGQHGSGDVEGGGEGESGAGHVGRAGVGVEDEEDGLVGKEEFDAGDDFGGPGDDRCCGGFYRHKFFPGKGVQSGWWSLDGTYNRKVLKDSALGSPGKLVLTNDRERSKNGVMYISSTSRWRSLDQKLHIDVISYEVTT